MNTIEKLRFFILQGTLVAGSLFAQDSVDVLSDDEIFNSDAFDQAFDSAQVNDSENKLKYEPGIQFVSEASAYHSLDSRSTGSDLRFLGKLYSKVSKPDMGALFLGLNYNYFLYASANSPFYQSFYERQSPDPKNIDLSLSEFHYSFDISKKVFLRLGTQLISWGASYFWSPADFINRQRAQAELLSVVDSRAGKPGVRVHVPIRNANLFLFTDLSEVTKDQTAQNLPETIAQAWRIDGTVGGVNLGTVGYISKDDPAYIGFDATGNIRGIDLYGECALAFNDGFKTVPDGSISIGGSKLFGSEKTITARTEFYANSEGFEKTDISSLPRGSFTPFYSGKYYAYAELSTTKFFTQTVAVSLFGFSNLADQSYSATVQTTVDLPRVIPFTLYLRYNGGENDREFTSPFGGPAVQGGVRIRGEF